MFRNRAWRYGSCFLFLLLVFTAVFHISPRADGEAAKVVRVGYYENEVFQEGAREGAVRTGYAYEYYRKISEYTGWNYEYVYGSYADLYQALLDHKFDLLAGLAYRQEREEILSYPGDPMGHESYNLLKHAADEDITASPATMNGKRIAVLDSAMVEVLQKYLEQEKITAEVIPLPDYEAVFQAFDNHEAEIIAVEGNGTYGRNDAEILCTFGYSDYYLCVNKERPDLLAELNAAQEMLAIDEPNYINSLNEKYYPHTLFSRAFSSVEKDWIETHSEITVGYTDNYLPYSDTDENGEVTGLVRDVAPHIFETLGFPGLKITYRGYDSYDAMIADVMEGNVDAVFPIGGGLYFSEENGIYQTNPVTQTSNELIFLGKYTDETVSNLAVNENNRIHEYYVRTYFPEAKITHYPSAEACLDAVLSGEVTSTFLNGLRANDMLKNRKYRDLSLMHLTWNDDRCFGVKIGNDGLLKLLNRGINVIGSDYVQNQVYRYTDQLHRESFLDYFLDHLAVFGSIILAAGLLIIMLLARDGRRQRAAVLATEKALQSAEEASRAKTTFLNNMSHDMRTPMNAIVGFTTLARSSVEDPVKVRDYLDKIDISSRHLLSLINDVLDMSRIESGMVKLESTETNIPEILHDLEIIVRANAAEKKQEFLVNIEDMAHPDVLADRLRLNRVLLNILSNAVKYTPEGGTIRLYAAEKPSDREGCVNYEFRISDNGIGMSSEFRKTIFDAFTRERSSTVSGIPGTGLGMAITKNIVDMMGGTISVESEEGKGSEFTVNIPFRFCSGNKAPDAELSGKEPAGHLENASADSAESRSGAAAGEMPLPDFTGRRVLFAEDNEMNQIIAIAILEKTGLAIELAHDGLQAVEMVKAASAGYYDAILMDIQMPNMNGYDAARTIRAMEEPAKAKIPIVAVTANAFEEDRKTAMEAGMNGHLAKPYDIPKMMEMLTEILVPH